MFSFLENASTILIAPAGWRARFASGVVFSLVAAVFNAGSTFAVNVAIANFLGRETFGEFAIVLNTLLTIANVAALGTGLTVTKYVAEFRSVDRDKAGRIMALCTAIATLMGSLLAITLLVGAPWLARLALSEPQLTLGLRLTAVVVFFNVTNFVYSGVLAGLEAYPALAKAGVISGTAYLLACVAGAYVGGRDGALAGLAISVGVQWLTLRFFWRRECARQRIVADYGRMGAEREAILKFALPAALSGLSSMPALWLANTALVRQADGYAQWALYAAAANLRVTALFLPTLLNSVGMSLLNNARGLGDRGRYRKVYGGNLAMAGGVTLTGAVGMALVGPALLSFFGRGFEGGYPVLVVLLVSTLFEALTMAVRQVVQSHGKMWLSLFILALPRDGLIVLLAYKLTPAYGAVGLALAYTAGWGLVLILNTIAAWHLGWGMWGETPSSTGTPSGDAASR